MAKKKDFNASDGLFGSSREQPAAVPAALMPGKALNSLTESQGRKGRKLPRINMAFTQLNYDFIKASSSAYGISMTDFVNSLIEADRNKHRR